MTLRIEVDLDNDGTYSHALASAPWTERRPRLRWGYGAVVTSGVPLPQLAAARGSLTLDNDDGLFDPASRYSPLVPYLGPSNRHAVRVVCTAGYERTLWSGLIGRIEGALRIEDDGSAEVTFEVTSPNAALLAHPVSPVGEDVEVGWDTDSCAEIERKAGLAGLAYRAPAGCSAALYHPYRIAGTRLWAQEFNVDAIASVAALAEDRTGVVELWPLEGARYSSADAIDVSGLPVYAPELDPNLDERIRLFHVRSRQLRPVGEVLDPATGAPTTRGTPVEYGNVLASIGARLAYTTGDAITPAGADIAEPEASNLTREVLREGQSILQFCGPMPEDPAIAEKRAAIAVARRNLDGGRTYSAAELARIAELERAVDSYRDILERGEALYGNIPASGRPPPVSDLVRADLAAAQRALADYLATAGTAVDNAAARADINRLTAEIAPLQAALDSRLSVWRACLDSGGIDTAAAIPSFGGGFQPIVLRSRGDSVVFYIGSAFAVDGGLDTAGVVGIDKSGATQDANGDHYPDMFAPLRVGDLSANWDGTPGPNRGGRAAPVLGTDYTIRVLPLRSLDTIAVEIKDLTGRPATGERIEGATGAGGYSRAGTHPDTLLVPRTALEDPAPAPDSFGAHFDGWVYNASGWRSARLTRLAASDTAEAYAYRVTFYGAETSALAGQWRLRFASAGAFAPRDFLRVNVWRPRLYELESTGRVTTINVREGSDVLDEDPRSLTLPDRLSARRTRVVGGVPVSEAAYVLERYLAAEIPAPSFTATYDLTPETPAALQRLVDRLEPGALIVNAVDTPGLRVPGPILVLRVDYSWDASASRRLVEKRVTGIRLQGALAEPTEFAVDRSRVDGAAGVG